MKGAITILILVLSLTGCKVQNSGNLKRTAQLDSIMISVYKPDEPGASVIVFREGKILLQEEYGLANYVTKEPITSDHVFFIGSITKQFTAQAVLLLEEQGKLSMTDPIQKFLPDYPYPDKKITVENLLTHTSGLVDVFEVQEWFSTWEKELTPQQFIDVFKNEPLLSEPGTQYHYSNFNYAILGLIIEKLSGQTFTNFITGNFFKPIGMNNTYIPESNDKIENIAKGYFKASEGIESANTINNSHLFAAGSIVSCPGDMLKWYRWLSDRYKAGDQKVKKALTQYTLADGTKASNVYGMMLFNLENTSAAGNNGGMLGYTNYTLWLYEEDIVIVLLSNHRYEGPDQNLKDAYNVSKRATDLAKAAMGILSPVVRTDSVNFITIPGVRLDKYTGVYKVEENVYRIITRKGNQLYTRRSKEGSKVAMNPLTETHFCTITGSEIEFVFNKDSIPIEANWIMADGKISVGTRTNLPVPEEKKPEKITESEYEAVCGLYKMMVVFDVKVYRNDSTSIIVESKQRGKSVFYPESTTRFFFADDETTVVEFSRTINGSIDGFKMTANGRTYSAKRD
jgi:CubicO group peptidase (beta-lactamase class C family)